MDTTSPKIFISRTYTRGIRAHVHPSATVCFRVKYSFRVLPPTHSTRRTSQNYRGFEFSGWSSDPRLHDSSTTDDRKIKMQKWRGGKWGKRPWVYGEKKAVRKTAAISSVETSECVNKKSAIAFVGCVTLECFFNVF